MLHYNFNRKQWISHLQHNFILPLPKDEIVEKIKKINQNLSVKEIQEIYFPISKLLNFNFHTNLERKKTKRLFSKTTNNTILLPYIIGISGSVASGKSTVAQIFQTILINYFYRKVELVTTDGFLHPNYILSKKKLINKKGFPETYNNYNLINFISKIRSGTQHISIPIYSHSRNDILSEQRFIVSNPEILILEGLNVLQNKKYSFEENLKNISILDFINFSIYIDASENLLRNWYIQRVLHTKKHNNHVNLCDFHKKKIINRAKKSWKKIHFFNLKKYILPTRNEANLILRKNFKHTILNIKFRK